MSGPWEDARVADGLARLFETRRAALDQGVRPIGWKVGFGAPASLELLEISGPLLGFLTEATVLPSGSEVSTAGWTRGIVEFEVAVYMGADVASGVSSSEAAAAVAALGPAIELANVDLQIEAGSVAEVVAGNIFHEAVIFGARDAGRGGLDISALTARILIDGVERASTTDLQAITGLYPEVVATVANTLAMNDEVLRAGEVIITGSVIPPIPVGEGTEFTFILESFDPISVLIRSG